MSGVDCLVPAAIRIPLPLLWTPLVHDHLPLHRLSVSLVFPSFFLLPPVYLRLPLTLSRDSSEFSSLFSLLTAHLLFLPFSSLSVSHFLSPSWCLFFLSRRLFIPSNAQVSLVRFYLCNILFRSYFFISLSSLSIVAC